MSKHTAGPRMGADLRYRLEPEFLSWDVFLFGEINDEKISETVQHILTLDATNTKKNINLVMNTPGGDCSAGYALIDIMLSSRHPIRTIALGGICSMGALIFISGRAGQRYIGSRAEILFHPVRDMVEDYSTYIKDRVKSLSYIEETAEQLMRTRTSLPERLIKKSLNGELWLTPREAVEYKVADHLIVDADQVNNKLAKKQKGIHEKIANPK